MLEPRGKPASPRAGLGPGPAGEPGIRPDSSAGILASRIAAILARTEPGTRLSQPSVLARRHNVTTDQAAAAVSYLVARGLVRSSPDGRLYRAGPADCLVSLGSMAGLGAVVDPMARDLTCQSWTIGLHPASVDTARALGMQGGEPVGVLRLAWALDGKPAALSTTYLAAGPPERCAVTGWVTAAAEHGELPVRPPPADGNGDRRHLRPHAEPRALAIQMDLPPSSAARQLGLAPGQMAVLITALFTERAGHHPAALTAAVLRPDMFRITLDTATVEPGGWHLPAAWSLASADPDR